MSTKHDSSHYHTFFFYMQVLPASQGQLAFGGAGLSAKAMTAG